MFQQLKSPHCADGGAGGQPQPTELAGSAWARWCWEMPVFLTQLLTEQQFVLSQQVQPWTGTQHPLRTRSWLRGPRAGGDTPNLTQTRFIQQGQGVPEALEKLEAWSAAYGLGVPKQHPGVLPHRDHWAWGTGAEGRRALPGL